ncbi:MAG: GHKL domain-containing protein, partial [Ferruginibacter sp.]|nr:GHKL domain-containing protein [Ferruginibacter sp.]
IDNIKYDENFWKFSIQDFGIGIPENKTSEVFHLFKRINVSNDFEGSGIGLATCKKIIEFYKGKIWIESKENSYTTVNILLPIHLIIN